MKIIRIDIEKYLSSRIYDPSPHRFYPENTSIDERMRPISYYCENCSTSILFQTEDFEKHALKLGHTNLSKTDSAIFEDYMKDFKEQMKMPFLDFYCPKCHQATRIIYEGGPSGYWGYYSFEIKTLIVLKN
jgi:Zn finger protein HypA/HybF involved in hydrogenase expression